MDAKSAPATQSIPQRDLANAIRALAMDAVEAAKSGHPGMPMGMADVATVLFQRHLKFDAAQPDWPDRDRFVLSAGHGSMLIYALLHLTGYPEMTLEELKNFRQWGSKTAGHPEFGHAPGIETTTGPLGQGLANAVGMALAERILNARFGDDLVDHHTYVIAGDGCLMEGISHEAISLAGHLKLNKLIVLFDDNGISIDGAVSLSCSDDQLARFAASGWATARVDGHDPEAVSAAIEAAKKSDRPSLIACRTVIGYGAPNKAGSSSSHGSPLGKDEIAGAREKLGWSHAPFDIPAPIRAAWAEIGRRGTSAAAAWAKRLESNAQKAEFTRVMAGELPANFAEVVGDLKSAIAKDAPKIATRQSSQLALDSLVPAMPELIGGSADLTGSNNTKAKTAKPVQAGAYGGSYIYYGIREHGMAAAMNGMALHGGIIPFGGTFLVFTDYCRPAIRLSALMKQRVVYVMTHDSIGLGEDGPTHQPVEHLAALRAIPNLLVFRPCDTMETAECWALALSNKERPSVLALTRQALPLLRADAASANHCARGAYVIRPTQKERKVTLLATGSEVEIAVEAQKQLEEKGIGTAVVSMPSWELFEEQSAAYMQEVLGSGLRVAVEAAASFGWERYIGSDGIFIGMKGFGASAPIADLYKNFGITPAAIVQAVTAKL
ncbi:transketolase [Dongia mobilis]|uniref:Transketolase n=1 Tax=Dongia mobilis TaxID=578943 RepID=A0A4R6WH93_9PROT|nr:transketolase [Dongia mobilis]TDQ77645.1 transketolase [Dongia mobilis]